MNSIRSRTLVLGLVMSIAACFPGPIDMGADATEASDATTDETSQGDDVCAEGCDALQAPAQLSATIERATEVRVSWEGVDGATGYVVERCESGCAIELEWIALTAEPVSTLELIDDSVEIPNAPPAPSDVSASTDAPDVIEVSWSPVEAPAAKRYQYRVRAVDGSTRSAPSNVATGGVANRPVIGYRVVVDDGQPQILGLVTSWSDDDARAPMLEAPTVSASLGTYQAFVRLNAAGASVDEGTARRYRVAANTASTVGPFSDEVEGRRRAGAITYQWERSAGPSSESFASISGATSASFDDGGAPGDGATRWYRVAVRAQGAADVMSDAVAGARQGPPGVPGGVHASADQTDRIDLAWQPVSGAIGYHVYRDGTKLTTGNGVTVTSYSDLSAPAPTDPWGAPTNVSATDDDVDEVVVTWDAPVRPVGPLTTYAVSAVSAAGEGALSSEASGRRVAAALSSFDVEVTPTGGNATWLATGTTESTWTHETAPAPSITAGTLQVSQGTHRASVELSVESAMANAGNNVTYRVRGALQGGALTPASSATIGRRTTGPLSHRWERASSEDGLYAGFGGSDRTATDSEAPSNGDPRWYRATLSAAGAEDVTLGAARGWRLAFKSIDIGESGSCGLAADGAVWCWGAFNYHGDDGPGESLTPLRVPLPTPGVDEVDVGAFHLCVRSDGDVWCTGDNAYGALGGGSFEDRRGWVKVVDLGSAYGLDASVEFACAVAGAGAITCWGNSISGQCGNADIEQSSVLVPKVVQLGPSSPLDGMQRVATGTEHACACSSSGEVFCWGLNLDGQLGFVTEDIFGLFAEKVAGLPTSVPQLSLGNGHTCVRYEDAQVRCWGSNANGRLGKSGITQSTSPVLVPLSQVAEVAAYSASTCARRLDGGIYCWGSDAQGQLGNDGNNSDTSSPTAVTGIVGATAISGAASATHACALVGFEPWCWGANSRGQLGEGTRNGAGAPVPVSLP